MCAWPPALGKYARRVRCCNILNGCVGCGQNFGSTMKPKDVEHVCETVDVVYRAESGRILATLIGLLDDFDLAEDALHDAFRAAMEQWPTEGVPANPRAWLVSTGRFKAIDAIRPRSRLEFSPDTVGAQIPSQQPEVSTVDDEGIEDDRLRLILTCCHPALARRRFNVS